MSRVSYWAVVVAIVVAFGESSLWYSPLLFGKTWAELRGVAPGAPSSGIPLAKIPFELVRTSILVLVVARLVTQAGVLGWGPSARFGLWLWLGFPAMLLMGSVLWDDRPWKLEAIHAGDWLLKVLLVCLILGAWPRAGGASPG
jgi:uncharacterized protein DUF1761